MQSYPDPNTGAGDGGAPFYTSASSQHPPGLSNPDEIQLTAQLTRGLAPIMNAGPGGTMSDSQDPRAHNNVNHHYEQEQDPNVHGQHMQGGHVPMDQMGLQYDSPDGSTAPRKRSKVSRACDECRRKKIRCDATGEQGDENCSSCKRTGTRCQFSRVPMKRGPSKGYIKELADRLNHLEGAMQVQSGDLPTQQQQHSPYENPLHRRTSDEFPLPPPNTEGTPKKRTYSSVSGDFASPYQPARNLSNWPPQDTQRHLPPPSSSYSLPNSSLGGAQMFREPDYSPTGMQPLAQWRNAPAPIRRQSSSFESMGTGEPTRPEGTLELDDTVMDGYYKIIHPTFPLLPQSKHNLNLRLSKCTSPLVDAFNESLRAAVQSFPSPTRPQSDRQHAIRAANLVFESQLENTSTRCFSANIVHLQAMILMAIEAGNHGPNSLRGKATGSPSVWLGSAVGLAYSLKLHSYKQPEKGTESDPDGDDKLMRRVWWSLVIMDRWHASSTASPLLIPDSSVVIDMEDKALLGEPLYQLARLSVVLGHLSEINILPTDLQTLSIPPILGVVLRGELERWREGLPESLLPPANVPLVYICYWPLRVLMELRLADSEPYDLLEPAMRIVTELLEHSTLVSPLTYHSSALAALTLIELSSYKSTRDEAEMGLKSLMESHIAPSGWDTTIRELIAVKQQRNANVATITSSSQTADSQHALTASQGLQHLAELATARDESRDVVGVEGRKENEKGNTSLATTLHFQRYHELRHLVKGGYLNAFGTSSGESGR